jgi:Protein of unknown function (DUF2799)
MKTNLSLRILDITVLGSICLALAGCGAMSKSDCEKADWNDLGHRDAMAGKASAAGFKAREDACVKAGVLTANPAAYFNGHQTGQLSRCTHQRGKEDAMAGQTASPACETPQVQQAYKPGYREGLQGFCTIQNGYDLGRNGLTKRSICPTESSAAFDTGFRLGAEVHQLNSRLATVMAGQAEQRKLLEDSKRSAAQREAASRRLGQLDSDEIVVRRLVREAEAKSLAIVQASQSTQHSDVSREAVSSLIIGQWQLESVRFAVPVDLNRDGVKSTDAMQEYNSCMRNASFSFDTQGSVVRTQGVNTAGCTPTRVEFIWKAVDSKVRDARYEAGRRIVDERAVVAVQMRAKRGFDSITWLVQSISNDGLVVRTDLPDGGDSSSEATVRFTRLKP